MLGPRISSLNLLPVYINAVGGYGLELGHYLTFHMKLFIPAAWYSDIYFVQLISTCTLLM